jgi:large repetitive protein
MVEMQTKPSSGGGTAAIVIGGVALAGTGVVLLVRGTKKTAALTGTVLSAADNSPISGAVVVIGTQTQTTGATGKFSMTGLPTGSQNIGIAAPGFLPYSKSITLVAGTQDMTFLMSQTVTQAALSGTATSIDTGAVLAGVHISAGGKSTTTDSDGNYSLTGLTVGTVTGSASLSGYATVTKSITLVTGQNTWNPQLTDLGNVTGTVKDSVTSVALAGVTVKLGTMTATTNAAGQYTISKVPSGPYNMTFSLSGYTTQTLSVTIQPGTTVPLDCQLVKSFTQTASVKGTVSNSANGSPLAGVELIFSANGNSYSTTSNASGLYELDGLPTGPVSTTYSITGTLSGFNQYTGSVTLAVGSISTKNISMTPVAPTTGGIIGGVNDYNTLLGISGAQINLLNPDGSQTGISTTTASDGSFSLSNVPAGTYQCWASKSGYSQAYQNVTVTAGNVTVMLAFYLKPTSTAIGFEMDVAVDPSSYPTAVYWYADINGLIFNYFAKITALWNEDGAVDMSRTDFTTQTLTVQLFDINYNQLSNAVVPLGGAAGPKVKNGEVYTFNVQNQTLVDDGPF